MQMTTRMAGLALALGWSLMVTPAVDAAEMVSVNKARVVMRDGPGTRHEALWTLDPGYPLAVIGRQGRWLRVRDFEQDTGWVYRPLTNRVRHHVVKARIANIRRGPGTKTPIVGTARYGEVLRTLGSRPGWVQVRQPGGPRGWVSRPLLWGW